MEGKYFKGKCKCSDTEWVEYLNKEELFIWAVRKHDLKTAYIECPDCQGKIKVEVVDNETKRTVF